MTSTLDVRAETRYLPRAAWTGTAPAWTPQDPLASQFFFNRYGVGIRAHRPSPFGEAAPPASDASPAAGRLDPLTRFFDALAGSRDGADLEGLQAEAAEAWSSHLERCYLAPMREGLAVLSRTPHRGAPRDVPPPQHNAPRPAAAKKARPHKR